MSRDYQTRGFVGGALTSSLTGSIGTGDSSMTFTTGGGTGYPTANFPAVLDAGTASEEKILCGARSGDNLTGVLRAQDGTTAKTHTNPTITHVAFAQDFTEANAVAAALTTKGDSLWKGGTLSVAPARLAAGSDQQVIRYLAANSLGVETTWKGSIPIFADTTARDAAIASPSAGQACYLDTGASTEGLYFYNGTSWRQTAWNAPWGAIIAPALRTTAQTAIGTSFTDLTGVTLSPTAVGNRYWKISAHVRFLQNTGAGLPEIQIQTGASGAGTVVGSAGETAGAASFVTLDPFTIVTPSAGSAPYHVRAKTSANTTDTESSATEPAVFLIEDIGPSGAPA